MLGCDYAILARNALEISKQIPDLEKARQYERLAEWYLRVARSYEHGSDLPGPDARSKSRQSAEGLIHRRKQPRH
jgi:hypothetical protein